MLWTEGKIRYIHHPGSGMLLRPMDFRGAMGLLLCENGTPDVQMGAETVRLAPGQFLLLPEGMVCYASSEAEATVSLLAFPVSMLRENMELLDRDLYDMFVIQARTRPVILTEEDPVWGRVSEAFSATETEYVSKETCFGLAMRAHVCRIVAVLLRRYANGRVDDERMLFHNVARFTEVLAYAESHLDDKLTVAHLAEQVHLSPDYFSHLLSTVTGKTVIYYLRAVRVNAAMRMLIGSEAPVGAVGRAVGFGAGDYFASVFKQSTGYTPGAFRTMAQETPALL